MVSNEPSKGELRTKFWDLPYGDWLGGSGKLTKDASMLVLPDTGDVQHRAIVTAMPDYYQDVKSFWNEVVLPNNATLIVNLYGNTEYVDIEVPYYPMDSDEPCVFSDKFSSPNVTVTALDKSLIAPELYKY